ncbi:hypothetical protein [Dactylosporangium sp. CA-139066]|uniref:hypothetical protein n=1 Tax=Dactylosporangium sp. CA-139066 TaxID=3239930 RepID=UPI003D92745C
MHLWRVISVAAGPALAAGGGRTTDMIHSDATRLQSWEMFSLIRWGGDGRTTDVIHTDATVVQS